VILGHCWLPRARTHQMLMDGYSPDVLFIMPESASAFGWRYPNVEHRTLGLGAISKAAFERGDNRPKALRQMTFERIGEWAVDRHRRLYTSRGVLQ
jgi:hypothetical protein